ncbi:MAG: hypothetical protein HQL30_10860 [Candidatus Omnitrophica bacterium]|nr:hypothetical protein [Candidatus Omnitrophota bacterium]
MRGVTSARLNENISKLMNALEETIVGLCKRKLEAGAEASRCEIITWYRKMKLFVLEKFHKPTYVSVVNLYKSEREKASGSPFGIVITYVDKGTASSILNMMRLLPSTESMQVVDKESMRGFAVKGCGDLARSIAERVVAEMKGLGHEGLVMSDPENITEPKNVLLPYNENVTEKYEFLFPVREKESVYVDIVMPIPA